MQEFPPLPDVDVVDGILETGHCWVEELIDGTPLRFQMRDSGLLVFGDDEHVFDTEDAPLYLRQAIRTVRKKFGRDAFRDAVDDVTSVTFFGVATHWRELEYDWAEMPAFLGTDVYDADREQYLPPNRVQQVFEGVNLATVPIVAKEVRAVDVDPRTYEIPDSKWYDGPAAGLVFTNKAGGKAVVRHDVAADSTATLGSESVEELLATHVSDAWLDHVVDTCDAAGSRVTVDAVVERAIEQLARETPTFVGDDSVAIAELQSQLAERVDRHLRTQR